MGRLSIQDLTIERAGRVVLRSFSAHLDSGGLLMIRGPNGSGKTSLLRAIAGLLPISAGRIDWDGAPMAQDWRQGGGRIVFVGHQEGIKGALTVRENLKFWSALMGTGDPETALNTMGLRQLQDRFARNLSAGQRRRLALARLLLGSWDLWLLDEPFTALDDWARTILLQSIREHLASGGMAIIAGHDNLDLPGSSAMLEEVVA